MEGDHYEVGKLYHPSRTTWPQMVQYQFHGGHHELVAFLRRPTLAEIEALTQGPADFALYVDHDLVLLLYRFRSLEFDSVIDWSDAPISIHRVRAVDRQLPPIEPGPAQLRVLVVDADMGVLHGARLLTLDERFTTALHQAIRDQAARPWSSAAHDRARRQLFARHRSRDLARQAEYYTVGRGEEESRAVIGV